MKKIFLNLGKQPLANSFLKDLSEKTLKNEFFYNLKICFDTSNFLVSVYRPVNPKKQYTDKYAHRASESKTMKLAFKKTANKLNKKFKPDLIMEIGSNDGVFLRNFPPSKVVAVEPCKNLANITEKKFKTYPEFWNLKLSKKIINYRNKKFDLIFSANTISHIPNIKETFLAINNALSDKGVMVIEDPSLLSVLKNNSYDQFYDEHVYVFSSIAMQNILKNYHLRLFSVDKISTHGGSLRYYICKNNSNHRTTAKLKNYIRLEKKSNLNKLRTYKRFAQRVYKSKKQLQELIKKIKSKNKKIISYGATYKSTTVFNYCNINSNFFDYVTDTTINKQGKFTPGTHIPIISPETGINDTVDYAFLGAWNFKKEILNKEKENIKKGLKFISHVPKTHVI